MDYRKLPPDEFLEELEETNKKQKKWFLDQQRKAALSEANLRKMWLEHLEEES